MIHFRAFDLVSCYLVALFSRKSPTAWLINTIINIIIVATTITSPWNRLYPLEIAKFPIPPAPNAPAIVVKPIKLIIVREEARIKLGNPSFKYTRKIISNGVHPMAIEASITPLSTSNKANCTCREKNGTVAITSGTIAPGIPIVVPTINLVNGINNIAKIINGIERNKFTTFI